MNQPDSSSSDDYPYVMALPDGGWLVLWNGSAQSSNGSSQNIIAQRYAADGAAVGGNFMLNSEDSASSVVPYASILADGNWLVSWQEWDGPSGNWDAHYQIFDPGGAAVGAEISTNNDPDDARSEVYSKGTALAGGGWVMSWIWKEGPTTYGLFYAHYDADGTQIPGGQVDSFEGFPVQSTESLHSETAAMSLPGARPTPTRTTESWSNATMRVAAALGANRRISQPGAGGLCKSCHPRTARWRLGCGLAASRRHRDAALHWG